MALRKPLVIVAGQIEQIQSGDTLDAVVTEVDVVDLTNNEVSPIVIGTPVYIVSNDKVKEARANASATVEVIGLVYPPSIAAAATGWIITDGVLSATTGQWDAVTGESGGLTAGKVYYLDADTAGMLTQTAPTAVGNYVCRVGKALSTIDMEITIEQPILL